MGVRTERRAAKASDRRATVAWMSSSGSSRPSSSSSRLLWGMGAAVGITRAGVTPGASSALPLQEKSPTESVSQLTHAEAGWRKQNVNHRSQVVPSQRAVPAVLHQSAIFSGACLTQSLEGQRREQDEKDRNQILQSHYSQVAKDTSDLGQRRVSSITQTASDLDLKFKK